MSNSADAARKIAEPGAHEAVRRVLDTVKAEKRTSLTAPEGKLVCDAYGIPVPKEGVAKSAAEAAKIASGMGFPGEGPGLLTNVKDWNGSQRYTVLFGQGLSVNALQAAGVFQTIANDGVRIPRPAATFVRVSASRPSVSAIFAAASSTASCVIPTRCAIGPE